jgi:hypothetical protein
MEICQSFTSEINYIFTGIIDEGRDGNGGGAKSNPVPENVFLFGNSG